MAASTRIVYNKSSQCGALLASAINHIIVAKQELARAKEVALAIGSANLNSDPAFGVEVVSGAELFTCVGTIITHLDNVTSAELARVDQS